MGVSATDRRCLAVLTEGITDGSSSPRNQALDCMKISIAGMRIMPSSTAARNAEGDRPTGSYQRHRPEQTLLYQIVEQHYPAFTAHLAELGRPFAARVAAGPGWNGCLFFLYAGFSERGIFREITAYPNK